MAAPNIDSLYAMARTLGGVPVLGCVPGSKSERAGVRYGDVVLAVNGQAVRSLSEFVRLRSGDDAPMRTVEVFRGGARVVIELETDGQRVSAEAADEYIAERGELLVAGAAAKRVGHGPD